MALWRCSAGCPHQRVDGFGHHSTSLLKGWGKSDAPVQVRQKCGLGDGAGTSTGRAGSGAPPTLITRAPCSQLQAQQRGSGSPAVATVSAPVSLDTKQSAGSERAYVRSGAPLDATGGAAAVNGLQMSTEHRIWRVGRAVQLFGAGGGLAGTAQPGVRTITIVIACSHVWLNCS